MSIAETQKSLKLKAGWTIHTRFSHAIKIVGG